MLNNQDSEIFFTNRGGNTLIREFEGVLSNNPSINNFDAVVGFLRASGYFALRPFLDNINKVRILAGIDVDKYIAEAANSGKLFMGAADEVREDYLVETCDDIKKSKYSEEVEKGIFQMVQDLRDGKLELRAHPSKKIHAKIYVMYPDNFSEYTSGMVITGSSNLSGNGLGISDEQQYEFNVKINRNGDVEYAKREFETLWEEAKDCKITADDINASINKTYLGKEPTPYEIYIKMLIEYFSDRVMGLDKNNPFDLPKGYTKYDYQMDAVIEGYQKLIRYDGFFLADVVGLGKTVIATMIAKKFIIENGWNNTKILVVYPPAIEENWKTTFRDFGLDEKTKFISNGSLSKILDEDINYWPAEEYDLILVDEAHKFRSNETQAFNLLQQICKMPRSGDGKIKGYKKKVMLISATPMNNSPEDIKNQILLFQDARRATIDGVTNLTNAFATPIKEFKRYRKDENYDSAVYKKINNKLWERVIKPLTVRRTRTDIESISRYSKDVMEFPKVEKPREETYELNSHLAELFEEAMAQLTRKLGYVRYQAVSYLKPEYAEDYDNVETASHNLAGIRKNGLVKRLESSFKAFQISLNNFKEANQTMIKMFEEGKVYITPDIDIISLLKSGYTAEEIEEKISAKAEKNPKNRAFTPAAFEDKYLELLVKDQAILDKMCNDWASISEDDDSKYAKFEELLKNELFRDDINKEGKLVVFSESVDTINYLKERIARDDVLVVTSENRKHQFDIIRKNFDANCDEKQNVYNILLSSDVLAEGVNLHRSNVIVNYDTPWNSTRLMQRIGRVNRIGSSSKNIYNYVFRPSRAGNRILNLNQIAFSKIQTFHSTYGEDNQIYSVQEVLEKPGILFDEAIRAEQEDINKEIPFYEEIRALYNDDRHEYDRIAALPDRSRTGRAERSVDGVKLAQSSVVFLKTNFRKLFFLVDDEAKELSTLEALKYFKASKEEKAVQRIGSHFNHIQKALKKFNELHIEELNTQEENSNSTSGAGAQVAMANSLLNSFMIEMNEDSVEYTKVNQLRELSNSGIISSIPKELQKIHKSLRKEGEQNMSHDEAYNKINEMAEKYAPYYNAIGKKEEEAPAEIILSESFT